MVLALRFKAVKGFSRGRSLVGFQERAAPQIDQGVRLFGPRSHSAARAVIFKAAPHEHLIIGQQRCRQRIACKALHTLPVKSEFHSLSAVDQTTAFGQTGAHL